MQQSSGPQNSKSTIEPFIITSQWTASMQQSQQFNNVFINVMSMVATIKRLIMLLAW